MSDCTRRRPVVPNDKRQNSTESDVWPSSLSSNMGDDVFTTSDEGVLTPPSLQSLGSEPVLSESADRVFPVKNIVRVNSGSEIDQTTPLSTRSDESPLFPANSRGSVASTARSADIGSLPSPLQSRGSLSSGNAIVAVAESQSRRASDEAVQAPGDQLPRVPSVDSAMNDGTSANRQRAGSTPAVGSTLAQELASPDNSHELLTASRFTYQVTKEGHSIVTGTDGQLLRCEDEPIHAPGAVQGFGLLIALKEEDPGQFVVRLASENSEEFIGLTPGQLFELGSFVDILSEEQQENLLAHIDSIQEDDETLTVSGPEIFNMSIKRPDGKRVKLWCAIHACPNQPELFICEFEHEDDTDYPLLPKADSIPDPASNPPLMMVPTNDGRVKGTQITDKPLKFTRKAQVGRTRSTTPMQIFDLLGQIQDRLSEPTSMDELLRSLATIMKEITSYHRVMVYQFDASYNGKVITEIVDAGYTEDIYYGLQFPASDIPPQARELYKINKMRLLYDRDLPTARLVCRSQADLDPPLDMTHCYLRAMSPIHLKYLENMGVRSSMSLSLKVFGRLWGLVSCHGVGSTGMRPPFPIRKLSKLVSNVASRNLERLSYETSLQAQKLINSRLVNSTNGSEHLAFSEDQLLKVFESDFGVVSVLAGTKTIGRSSLCQESLALLEYLRVKKPSGVLASSDITADFGELEYAPGFTFLGGMLYIPLSVDGVSFIVLFRKAQAREVQWGGNPYENKDQWVHRPLEPRTSFRIWREVVTGRSREWTIDQIELATVLCTVYGKFIQVWQQKEPQSHSSRLTQLLLANSAHQVRTPLNAIINYLEIALEGPLDKETRDNLAQSHSASKSLVYVINDLLDLTKTEEGQALGRDEVFNLPACIRNATDSFSSDATRKNLRYEVDMHSDLPRRVCGDRLQVKQAITNVIANAFQYTSEGFVQVTSYLAEADDGRVRIEIAVQDSGVGMSNEDMDRLFHDLEQIGDAEQGEDDGGDIQEVRKLGLGLAVVARIVRNVDGLLRVNSEPGQGSCFVLQLPFDLPEESETSSRGRDVEPKHKSSLPTHEHGKLVRTTSYSSAEVTLVPRASSLSLSGSKRTPDGSQYGGSQLRAGTTNGAEDGTEDHDEGESRCPSSKAMADTPVPKVSVSEPIEEKVDGVSEPVCDGVDGAPEPGADGVDGESTPAAPSPASTRSTKVDGADTSGSPKKPVRLQILIAEDDPVNIMFLKKRLGKLGHQIHHSLNGEDCATEYRNRSHSFDVILMDMQMPIMDGITSTKTIRSWERDPAYLGLSQLAQSNGQIPIFAVSASLLEDHREVYREAGFDGWIPKPINFERLCAIMAGISDDKRRTEFLYAPGKWEVGGWFEKTRIAKVE